MGKKLDLIGQSFGRLKVIREGSRTKAGKVRFVCICSCGNPNEVEKIGSELKSGHVKSCGCLEIETRNQHLEKNYTHNLSKHPLYPIWSGINSRCYRVKDKHYKDYGSRGIKNFWKDDFKAFYDWAIENGYKKGFSIERINVNGNYEPNNCTFIEMSEQARNTRRTVYLTAYGETKRMTEWAEDERIIALGLNYYGLRARRKLGWTDEEVLTTPLNTVTKLTYNGKTQSLRDWAKDLDITTSSLSERFQRGWTIEEALSTPKKGGERAKRKLKKEAE